MQDHAKAFGTLPSCLPRS